MTLRIFGFISGFVIAIILLCMQMKNVSNIFIFNLAIADFLFLMWIPLVILKTAHSYWKFGLAMCKLYFFSTGINQYGSVTFLTMLCIDRYLAVCHPIRSRPYRTAKVSFFVVAVCWFFVILVMLPLLIFSGVEKEKMLNAETSEVEMREVCALYWAALDVGSSSFAANRQVFTLYAFFLGFLVPLFIMWSLYRL